MKLKYPYYSQCAVPIANLAVVTTVDGTKEYRINCRKLEDGYYVKGKDLVLRDGVWFKAERTILDHELNIKVATTYGLLEGIVAVNPTTGQEQFGYFTPNPYNNCTVKGESSRSTPCIDYRILPAKFYTERLGEGCYYRTSTLSSSSIAVLRKKALVISNGSAPYNLVDDSGKFNTAVELYKNAKFPIDADIKRVAGLLKDITWGGEFETINGTLPKHIMNTYGVIICKDGSIKDRDGHYPPEYVTVPYSGAKGLQATRNVSREIDLRSDIDLKCSFHLHLGGFPIDRILMVALFRLCYKIQDDVFEMFPYYKRDEVKYASKEKNYCKMLPDIIRSYTSNSGDFNEYINLSYEDIYSFLTGGKKFDREYNMGSKRNPWGGHKWDILSRYYWVNFINPVFGKQQTIEFRLHTPTLNADKAINWLFMCAAIIMYAQNNVRRCIGNKPVTFEEVLLGYKTANRTPIAAKLSANLVNYYRSRVDKFKADYQTGDYTSLGDLAADSTFKYNIIP